MKQPVLFCRHTVHGLFPAHQGCPLEISFPSACPPARPLTAPQTWLFYTFPVCLPWISLIFGLIVLALVQIQGLGRHPALVRVVQPVLTGLAIGATLLKLSLMHAQQQRAPAAALNAAPDPTESANPAYLSGEQQQHRLSGRLRLAGEGGVCKCGRKWR